MQDTTTSLSESERLAWLRLARTDNVGPITFYRLMERFGTAQNALEALPGLSRQGGRKKPLTPCPVEEAEHEFETLHKMGGRIILSGDGDYPLALAAIEDAPPVLNVLGHMSVLDKPCIAMVGARNASLNGRKFAARLGRDLGEAGYCVVSGLARGIDAAAHESALTGGTAAILGGGVDVIYPKENSDLYQQIRDLGVVISETPPGTQPQARHFPRRNRIISGLSLGVVVVEATLKSGSLITARMAGEQGRDVFAVPGFPLDPRAQGPNRLIRDGALLIQEAADIIDSLNNFTQYSAHERQSPSYTPEHSTQATDEAMLEEARGEISQTLSHSPVHVDELIRACPYPIPVIQQVLLEMELAGRAQRHPGNRVSLSE